MTNILQPHPPPVERTLKRRVDTVTCTHAWPSGTLNHVEVDDFLQDDEETKGRKDRADPLPACLRESGGGGYETHAENNSEPARPPPAPKNSYCSQFCNLASSRSDESSKEVDPNGWNKADWRGRCADGVEGREGGGRARRRSVDIAAGSLHSHPSLTTMSSTPCCLPIARLSQPINLAPI